MSLRNLPEPKALHRPAGYQPELDDAAVAKWTPRAAEADQPNVISIYDAIGFDPWSDGGGFTAKRAAAALRSIGDAPVTVKINSPGGDMFEGIAIYNLFREHPAKVSVEVMGIAASAASIIAMAGDEIAMGLGSFLMIHNAWGLVIGNKADFGAAADVFGQFDSALTDIYEARSGAKRKEIEAMMDAETFMSPKDAVARGFADRVDDTIKAGEKPAKNAAALSRRAVDEIMAKAGVPRVERRAFFASIAGTQDAAGAGTQDAAFDPAAAMQLLATMKK